MTQYNDDDTGVLFQNREKQGKQPDYTGRIQLSKDLLRGLVAGLNDGNDAIVEVAGWKKQGPKAGEFLSLSAQLPRKKEAKPEADFEDEIPF